MDRDDEMCFNYLHARLGYSTSKCTRIWWSFTVESYIKEAWHSALAVTEGIVIGDISTLARRGWAHTELGTPAARACIIKDLFASWHIVHVTTNIAA